MRLAISVIQILIVAFSAIRSSAQNEERESFKASNVTFRDLTEGNAHNWLTYSGQYNSQRFSELRQIHSDNVHKLSVAWVRQFKITEFFEATPLVVNGVMYVTLPRNAVLALDAATGLRYWERQYPLPDQISVCCGQVNRGVAILGELIYMGTLDAHLVALDSKTGSIIWDVEVAQPAKGYSITAAPLVVKDLVITGVAGGEYGISGFVAAYDSKTGEERWRTPTIPGPGEDGNDTWDGDSWKTGGSATWMTGSYDPDLDLLYWGVGNPGPDWNGEVREGNNLFSDCVLALDLDTGEIKWHFQFTPHDVWDWDACQIPVLVDANFNGKDRKLMLFANRNAFYYVLDREEGEFLLARPFAKQTWAESIDDLGIPKLRPNVLPTKEGTKLYPELKGGTNWYSPSYSPQTKLFYVNAYDGEGTYFLGDSEYEEGQMFLGGIATTNEFEERPDPRLVSAIRALNPMTGERIWEYRMQPKSTSGLLSTDGNLLFGGTVRGNFFALDATSGKELWRLDLGGRIHAAPVTFMCGGVQYVTVAAGSALFTFTLRVDD